MRLANFNAARAAECLMTKGPTQMRHKLSAALLFFSILHFGAIDLARAQAAKTSTQSNLAARQALAKVIFWHNASSPGELSSSRAANSQQLSQRWAEILHGMGYEARINRTEHLHHTFLTVIIDSDIIIIDPTIARWISPASASPSTFNGPQPPNAPIFVGTYQELEATLKCEDSETILADVYAPACGKSATDASVGAATARTATSSTRP